MLLTWVWCPVCVLLTSVYCPVCVLLTAVCVTDIGVLSCVLLTLVCCCPVCVLLTAVCVTDTVLQPKLKKKRSVSKLEVGDTKNVSKYILTHQEPDSNDEMVTKLIKVPHSVALHTCCLVTGQLLHTHTPAGARARTSTHIHAPARTHAHTHIHTHSIHTISNECMGAFSEREKDTQRDRDRDGEREGEKGWGGERN